MSGQSFGSGGPFNYNVTPIDPMGNFTQGYMQADKVLEIDRIDAERKRQEEIRNQFQTLMSKDNISAKDIAPLIAISDPQQAQQLMKAHSLLDAEQQKDRLQTASQVMTALNSGDTELAIKTLRDKAEAAKNSGDNNYAHFLDINAQQIEIDPSHARLAGAMYLSSIPGGDKILQASSDVADRIRKEKLDPYEESIKQSEAIIRGNQASVSADKANAEVDLIEESAAEKKAKAEAKKSAAVSPDGVDYIAKAASMGFDLIGSKTLVTKSQMEQFQRNAAQMVKDGKEFDPEMLLQNMKDISQAKSTGRSAGSSKVLGQRENIDNALSLLDDMKETNRQLNLSKLKYKGKLENWIKDAANDPAFVKYRTQRADNLFQLTNALKQNGITDKSIEIEEQAAALTMDEKAFDAWYETQKTALERSKKQKEISYGTRKDFSNSSSNTSSKPYMRHLNK